MRNHFFLFSVLINFVALPLFAQYNETIRTDRPGQSLVPFTTGKGIFQLQSGVDISGNNEPITILSNNTSLRYGITETFELNVLADYAFFESNTLDGANENANGLRTLDIGMRYFIIEGNNKWLPSIGFQFQLKLPLLSEEYKINHTAPRFTIVTSNPIGKVTLVTNSGASWNGMDGAPNGFYTINLSWPFNNSLGGFVESYGTFANGPTQLFWDAGLGWLLNPNLQLDIYGGFGANDGIKSYFTSVGVSWRTKRK